MISDVPDAPFHIWPLDYFYKSLIFDQTFRCTPRYQIVLIEARWESKFPKNIDSHIIDDYLIINDDFVGEFWRGGGDKGVQAWNSDTGGKYIDS